MIVGELRKALEGVDDGAPVSLTFFTENAPAGFRIMEDDEVFVYHDEGQLFIQNREWDDGAS